MNIVALAGGVGGAKLAHGLALTLEGRGRLTVVVNTGDDFDWNGLRICPDLDTVTYTLGGLADPDTGWGVAGDTFECLAALQRLDVTPWFRIGDRDLATHLRRTDLLREGQSLTETTALITRALHIRPAILPMTDDRFRTRVETDAGVLEFQDYFVRRQWQPVIQRVIFDGADRARPTPQVNAAVAQADAIIFCPSNPFVSIEPILTLLPSPFQGEGSGVRVAVSPIVGGQALKGPAAKMFRELGVEPSAFAVAQRYRHIITHFVLDQLDRDQASAVQSLGLRTLVTDTWMKTIDDRARLAGEILSFIQDSWPDRT
jgi:LPPG:FO 2-phospho-L-lactate transferase